jgi:glucokinase
MTHSFVLGIDIGGTSTKFGVVSAEGKILSQDSIKTCENDDAGHFVDRLVAALNKEIEKFEGKSNFKGIGIGAPNGNNYTGSIEHAPNLKWKGIVPLVALIEERIGLKTVLTNDANAAAMGEMIYGNAKSMKDFILITLGTGLGSGIVVNGKVVYGFTGFAGELGHLTVDPFGRICGCGRRGCLETYASATGIVMTVKELLENSHQPSQLRDLNQADLTAKQITEAAQRGDELALKAYEMTAEILGRSLANAAIFSSPEAIFLFGGLAQARELLFNPTKKYFENNLLNVFRGRVSLLASGLPESDAAILGAAALIS